jgi:hypothetical protein
MAILTTFKVSGDPDELFALAREKIGPLAREAGVANGRIATTIARTDSGLMYVNVWENEEGMRRAAEQVGPVARDSGMPEQEDWQMYEVMLHDVS